MPTVARGVTLPRSIDVVDSHTEGEPTRVVVSGWPEPVGGTMPQRRDTLRREHDAFRRATILEPRGHDAVVGALLTPPVTPGALAGVIYFNDVGYLNMCGHGTIGVVRTLEFLGRITPGALTLDTPAGPVVAELANDESVTIRNVPARCIARDVSVDVPLLGTVTGDIAWGGNWFFLTGLTDAVIDLEHRDELLRCTMAIRHALAQAGITGDDGAPIDHIELFGPPQRPDADSRNFVLCPGRAYDRSPCGTGTSAKLACLHARGQLEPGQRYHQEGLVGSLFTGWLERSDDVLYPMIRGRAWITGRSTLLFDPDDPFREGVQ